MVRLASPKVLALCDEMKRYGISLTYENASKLLHRVGDHQLCVDALLMHKRPQWLEELVGPREKTRKKK